MRRLGGVLLALLVSASCQMHEMRARDRLEIERTLREQDAAWNSGDIDGFMAGYWQSPHLTFSSGDTVTRGWTPTRDRYRAKYASPQLMGRLTFSELEITPLGRDHALVLGRWHLQRDEPIGGIFSLVMRKNHGRWLIIHDHTSSRQP